MEACIKTLVISALSTILFTACSSTTPQDKFMSNLSALCGKSFAGKLVSTDAADKDLAAQEMVMHVASCESDEIRIPFNVGENRSRTWVVTKTENGLRLKHQHNHEDGHADKVTHYGGDTVDMGTATHQEFPVDQFSKDMFVREGLNVSVTNIWAIDITPTIFAYELRRENRHFRVEFDLAHEVDTPEKSW